jgi:hypothetical protein
MLHRPESPKLTGGVRNNSVYPYYAGFSERFVESTLLRIEASPSDLILDPWNGSGTTTAVCARSGIPSVGVDLNPAMRPIASVRSMSREQVEQACDHAAAVASSAKLAVGTVSPFRVCGELLQLMKEGCDTKLHDSLRFGLMTTCRRLARRVRSRNPTWHSIGSLEALVVGPSAVVEEAISSFAALKEWRNGLVDSHRYAAPRLLTGNWERKTLRNAVTHVITSPPYLTRIDYVMKTLPELLLLNEETPIDLAKLRQSMLGSVLTRDRRPRGALNPDTLVYSTLKRIQQHGSKASNTYYRRFFSNYFRLLRSSLNKVCKLTPEPRTITIVTQGSYYKEVFVDLPSIVDEFMEEFGYLKRDTFEFIASHAMTAVNTRSLASAFATPPERSATYERASQ